ncbi:MAG: acyltransferase [Deltaproteobacteria bacterium]|nr:acyltransferase [Deltaproteobacteria bacterium]
MRKDHRPYWLKSAQAKLASLYTERWLRPQFAHLGKHPTVLRPWCVSVFGYNISLGDFATIIAEPYARVHLISWAQKDLKDFSAILHGEQAAPENDPENWEGKGLLRIGHYALVCPGVRVQCATAITIGDGVMMAHGAYITDADWHGIQDRCAPVGRTAPVTIRDNAWIGDHAIVCKGVTIGENSVVGAGSVVVRDVPDNCIAAGNPAQVVRELDPSQPVVGREFMFRDYETTRKMLLDADREIHGKNTLAGWLRYLLFPRPTD